MEEIQKHKHYSKPFLRIERFTPNEYVAGCGGGSGIDIPEGISPVYRAEKANIDFTNSALYKDSNGNGIYDSEDQQVTGNQMSISDATVQDDTYVYFCSPGQAGFVVGYGSNNVEANVWIAEAWQWYVNDHSYWYTNNSSHIFYISTVQLVDATTHS